MRDRVSNAASRARGDGTRPERGDAGGGPGACPTADFVHGDALQMPFAERSFDRIFSSFFYGLLPEPDRERFLAEVRRVADEVVLIEPTPEWEPDGRMEGWEQRVLPDGSRYEIYRRYFTAESLAGEIDGSILFAGRWVALAAVYW